MTSCLIEVAQFVYIPNIHINISPEVYTDQILQKYESELKPEDFLTWCQKDKLIIELLDLVFETCHVVLGLRPASQQDEVTIAKYVIKLGKCLTLFFSLKDIFFDVKNIHLLNQEWFILVQHQNLVHHGFLFQWIGGLDGI
jgi:hypothetical protein